MPAEQIRQRRPGALVGNMRDLNAGRFREQHGAEMYAAPAAGRSIIQLARLRLGERDELLHVVRGHRRVYQDYERTGGDKADRREVLALIVAGVRIKRRVDGERAGAAEPEGVAVGRGLGDLAGADRTAGPTAGFHSQPLDAPLAQ